MALSLIVFFSGGLNSPIIAMFIVYIMISTFLTDYHKAFRNTLEAMLLLLAIALLQNSECFFSSQQIMNMLAFDFMFIFTYFVSGYLSKNLHNNEDLLKDLLKQTQELSISDGLTGLYNQMHFFELLDLETKKSQRYNLNYSLIIFDVDHFKNYNDHNGHLRGSETLKGIGAHHEKQIPRHRHAGQVRRRRIRHHPAPDRQGRGLPGRGKAARKRLKRGFSPAPKPSRKKRSPFPSAWPPIRSTD